MTSRYIPIMIPSPGSSSGIASIAPSLSISRSTNPSHLVNIPSDYGCPCGMHNFDDYNHYLYTNGVDIGIIEYIKSSKDILVSEPRSSASGNLLFNALITLVTTGHNADYEFTIPVSLLGDLGIDIERKSTFSNKINKIFGKEVNKFKNQYKTLRYYKFEENIHFTMSRMEVARDEYIQVGYFISRNAYLLLINRAVSKHILKDIGLTLSKIIGHYNAYRDKLTKSRLSELKRSIVNVSSEVNKLASIAEEINADFDLMRNTLHDRGDIDNQLEDTQFTMDDSNADVNLRQSIHQQRNNLYKTFIGSDHMNSLNSRATTTRRTNHTVLASGLGNHRDSLGNVVRTSRSMTELVVRPSNTDITLDCIGLHAIHKKFKKVARDMGPMSEKNESSVYTERLTSINDELFNINKQIDAIIDSIEYSESV